MANLGFTYAVASVISATVSVSYASASVSYIEATAVASPQTEINFTYSIPSTETKISAVASPKTKILFDYVIIPMTNIPSVGVSVSDSAPLFNSELAKTESLSILDSPVFSAEITKSDSVTIQDNSFKSFTSNVDFDLSDSDVDPDPINISDAQIFNTELAKTESLSISDSPILNVDLAKTDSVSMSDSPEVYFILPDFYAYPDSVVINDGDIGGFIMRTTEPFTGVIGSPGLIGQIIVNDDKVTTGDDFTGLSAQLS
tara:strand:- start:1343 stop:2116 length:774 start_codon:yes stop_codon:yes gene_type:complete